MEQTMKITVETLVKAPVKKTWDAYNTPADITKWNQASADWHTTRASVDLREGGRFVSRMEAKDGSAGFDFGGTYTKVVPNSAISSRMDDGREADVLFEDKLGSTAVTVTFDAETQNTAELQRGGWQAILDNFGLYVEGK
jgi:uncharacterized protein YndB with AHSA1/START domain